MLYQVAVVVGLEVGSDALALDWVMEVVLGGRKLSLMDLILGCAVQLSRIRTTFLFYLVKILSCL